MAQNQTAEQKLREFRVEHYRDMRFSSKEAELLADAKGDDGFPLNYRKVKAALEKGCTHKLAVKIFT
jgi:hypothetical protein